MGLFKNRWSRTAPGIDPEWVVTLPSRLSGPRSLEPRILFTPQLVVAWGEGLVLGFDPDDGKPVYRRRIKNWQLGGFDAEGQLLASQPGCAPSGRLDPSDGMIIEDRFVEEAAVKYAVDDPDRPEEDPLLIAGIRSLRARSETRSRVTRHWIEIQDQAGPLRRWEVAHFTLRSDHLRLTARGGGRIYGSVGPDPEIPAGALAGTTDGPLLILRRRYSTWHEHHIPIDEPDMIGHGPAQLEWTVVPEGADEPRSALVGPLHEKWKGLGRRRGPSAFLAEGLGARPVGITASRIFVEFVSLEDGSRHATGLIPVRRFLAAFPIP